MKRILSIIAAVLFVASVFAQVPERISYQAVVRNTKGLLIINTQIGMEINIRRSTPTGTIVYTETQTPTTNANGLVSIEIGTGSEFSAIRWGNDTYFIETKTAVEPPLTDYTITGISKLLSVPYALHAKTADSITGPITEADPLYTASQASNITAADLVKLSNLSGVNTGDQDLSSLATTASVTTGLATKVDKVEGKGLSTNDYTTTEQSKLAGIATGAEVNVNADWNATSGDAQILNKPTIPTAADGSETKVTAGTSITVSGTGTTANPYVINGPVSTTLTIGQSYQGGVIFWLDATGQHGLIAATVDQGHLIKWSKNNDRIIGASGDGMYAGAMNTAIIVAALMPEHQTETFAAQLCADYSVTVDGVMYGDWYLPSIYELKLLQQKKDIVGNFIAESYWSSTEYTQTGHPDYPKLMANSLSFSGFQYEPTGDYKYSTSFKNVRAIRAF